MVWRLKLHAISLYNEVYRFNADDGAEEDSKTDELDNLPSPKLQLLYLLHWREETRTTLVYSKLAMLANDTLYNVLAMESILYATVPSKSTISDTRDVYYNMCRSRLSSANHLL